MKKYISDMMSFYIAIGFMVVAIVCSLLFLFITHSILNSLLVFTFVVLIKTILCDFLPSGYVRNFPIIGGIFEGISISLFIVLCVVKFR